MQSWTLEQWLTLISAVTAAIVSIANAIRGKSIAGKIDQHEERAQARAAAACPPSSVNEPATIINYPALTDSMGIKPPGGSE